MSDSTYQKIFAGGETDALALKNALEEEDIAYIERNNIQSGLRGGFYGGTTGVEILVQEGDADRAKKIVIEIFD